MKKIVMYLVFFGIVVGALGYYFTQRDYRDDIKYKKPDEEISAEALFAAFETNESEANTRFLGKTLLVLGTVEVVEEAGEKFTIKLQSGDPLGAVVCEMNSNLQTDFNSVKVGENMAIKGVCSGKLLDIILVNCIIE